MALFQKIQILTQAILCVTYKMTSSESDQRLVLECFGQETGFLAFSLGIKPWWEILILLPTVEGHGWTQLL